MSFNKCHAKRCSINTKNSLANCTCGFTHKHRKLKIAELRTKLADAVGALGKAYGMVNAEKGYCPQCGDGTGTYHDNYGGVCQCQWCFEANLIKEALTKIKE